MIPPNATSQALRVLFVADGGAKVGGGHLMRCLTLAGALEGRGAACAVLAHPGAVAVLEAFAPATMERLACESADPDALAACAEALAWGADVVVCDHYGLSAPQEARLRRACRRLIVIDDLADRPHDCDLLVDPSYGRAAAAYDGLLPASAEVLAGPKVALVRPEFAAAREAALSRRAEGGPVRRVLVSLGLTDLGGITVRVVQAMEREFPELCFDVVLGRDAPSLGPLRAKQSERVELHVDSRDMAALTAQADVAVGAGGSSTWERACLGLPTLHLILADNQRPLAHDLARIQAVMALEAGASDFDAWLVQDFRQLVAHAWLRQRLSKTSAALCDGQGAERVADAVLALSGKEA